MQNFAKIFVFKTEDGRPNINSDARLPSNAPHLSKNLRAAAPHIDSMLNKNNPLYERKYKKQIRMFLLNAVNLRDQPNPNKK